MTTEEFERRLNIERYLLSSNGITETEFAVRRDELLHELRGGSGTGQGGTEVTLNVGDTLGSAAHPYRLISPLGYGSFGWVWRALDIAAKEIDDQSRVALGQSPRAPNDAVVHHVALKVLKPQFTESPIFVSSLAMEANRLREMDHPNIVKVSHWVKNELGHGAANGYHFIVMDFLQGTTLEAIMAERVRLGKPWQIRETLTLIDGIANALQYAYESRDKHDEPRRLIHRDLKPANIMLVPRASVAGRAGALGETLLGAALQDVQIKLLDFGLAAQVRNSGSFIDTPAQGHRKSGTQGYMAPESLTHGGLEDPEVGRHVRVGTECPGHDVALGVVQCLVAGEFATVDQLLDVRVIHRHL